MGLFTCVDLLLKQTKAILGVGRSTYVTVHRVIQAVLVVEVHHGCEHEAAVLLEKLRATHLCHAKAVRDVQRVPARFAEVTAQDKQSEPRRVASSGTCL